MQTKFRNYKKSNDEKLNKIKQLIQAIGESAKFYKSNFESSLKILSKSYQNLLLRIDNDFESLENLIETDFKGFYNFDNILKKHFNSNFTGLIERIKAPVDKDLIDVKEIKDTHEKLIREARGRKFLDEQGADMLFDTINMSLYGGVGNGGRGSRRNQDINRYSSPRMNNSIVNRSLNSVKELRKIKSKKQMKTLRTSLNPNYFSTSMISPANNNNISYNSGNLINPFIMRASEGRTMQKMHTQGSIEDLSQECKTIIYFKRHL